MRACGLCGETITGPVRTTADGRYSACEACWSEYPKMLKPLVADYPAAVYGNQGDPVAFNLPTDRDALSRLLGRLLTGRDDCPSNPDSWWNARRVIERMKQHGFWLLLKSPFVTYGPPLWWAGFTPHETSGWNGTPDYYASGATGPLAIVRAAILWMLKRSVSNEEKESKL